MNKVIITVLGRGSVGITAKVCTHPAAECINVLDINQATVQDHLHMMMIADISVAEKSLEELTDVIQRLGEEAGLRIHVQREEIFKVIYRI